jgi:hypothetical protein
MAGRSHRSAGTPKRGAAPVATTPIELETTEVAPIARVKRSRLAFALAITLAGLPVLVLDNFPATADPAGRLVVAAVVTTTKAPAEPTTTMAPTSTAEPAIAVAPVTTVPAPPSTEAPTTTAAPATSTTKVAVRTVAAPTTTTAPPTTQPPAPAPTYAKGDPNDPASWDRMAQCEAGGNWAANTGNGYYGGLQFSLATWQHYGGSGYPHEASKDAQIAIGKRVQAAEGWGAWPGCARSLGYT